MNTLYHVGYRKCASTFLQHALFSRHPALHLADRSNLTSYIIKTSFGDYDSDRAREAYQRETKKAQEEGKSAVILSDESMLTRGGIDPSMIADRLYRLNPSGKVLIVIRNQNNLLASYHTQSIATRKTTITSLSRWIDETERSADYNTYLDKIDFNRHITEYDKVFGEDRVGVFLLEDMKSDAEGFLKALCDYIEIDVGPSKEFLDSNHFDNQTKKIPRMPRSSRWSILVRSNPLARALDTSLRPFAPAFLRKAIGTATGLSQGYNQKPDQDVQRFTQTRYAEGNLNLGKRLGRDLSELGYPI